MIVNPIDYNIEIKQYTIQQNAIMHERASRDGPVAGDADIRAGGGMRGICASRQKDTSERSVGDQGRGST
ncbi:MAG TPA: hypothetical protein VJM79_02025 [Rhizorhapis sp.]|nr:hypothetical protein [Rhizorhapis sp.]